VEDGHFSILVSFCFFYSIVILQCHNRIGIIIKASTFSLNNEKKFEPLSVKDLIFNGNQNPDHPAIECPGYQPLTYQDLRIQVLRVIKTLNSMGFGRNDRIAVIMHGGPETAVLGIALMTGFTHTPLNPQYKESEFQVILSRLKVKAIIVQKNHETAARTVALSSNIPLIEIISSTDNAGIFEICVSISDDLNDVLFAQLRVCLK